MNIIKQSISKKFTRKYHPKVELPEITFVEKCIGVWLGGILCGAVGGGIYGSYGAFKKWNGLNEDVVVECMIGVVGGIVVGIFSPFIIPGYLIKKISDNIE